MISFSYPKNENKSFPIIKKWKWQTITHIYENFHYQLFNSKCTSYSNNYIWITIIYLIYICHAFFSLHLTSWTMSLTCQGYPRSGGGGGYRRPRGTRGGGGHRCCGCRGDRWGLLGRGGGPADRCRTWITALVFEKKKKSHATFY